MNRLRLAARLFRRDLSSGAIRVLLLGVVLAVFCTSTVGMIADRAERALALEANALLGGDLVLRADRPIDPAWARTAEGRGLEVARTATFPSMVRYGDRLQLVEIKAQSANFPLRGRLEIRRAETAAVEVATSGPAPGEVWVAPKQLLQVGATLGDTLRVGGAELRLAALIVREPDAAFDYFDLAPRVLLHEDDLPATGLIQEGSRVIHRLVVAGPADAVEAYAAELRPRLDRGQRLESSADARPEIRAGLERARQFLDLSVLLAVVLSAVAVALAARQHSERQLDAAAVLRVLGATQGDLLRLYLGQLAYLWALGSALGLLLADLVQALLAAGLAAALGLELPRAGLLPWLGGAVLGALVVVGFAVPPLLRLRQVPALKVLRRELPVAEPSAWLVGGLGLGTVLALMVWKAGDLRLATAVLVGLALTVLLLALAARLALALIAQLRGRLPTAWRMGLANLRRRPLASSLQVVALGLGLLAVLLLATVRSDLIQRWREALPADAPNRFLINVQPDQVEAVEDFLSARGLTQAELYPMVRGRLVSHNGAPVDPARYSGPRAQRLAEREFNLSWAAALKPDNRIVAGRFWSQDTRASAELSVEAGIARTLGWSLGDELGFDVGGRRFSARITSLREVRWESFTPNFFVLAPPGLLDDYAASYISSLYLPPERLPLAVELIGAFPNLSLIDLDAILTQVRGTAEQVARAIEYVFYFTLAAGLLVLFATLVATQRERLLEAGTMRVLGARTGQLRAAHAAEFGTIGLIAGSIAAAAASAIAWALSTQAFELPYRWNPGLSLGGALVAAGLVALFGLFGTRPARTTPPAQVLRALD